MTDKPEGKRWGWGTIALMAAVLFGLYVLMIGPTFWVAKTTGWPWLYAVHGPVKSLSDSWPVSENLMESYLEVWNVGELQESATSEILYSE